MSPIAATTSPLTCREHTAQLLFSTTPVLAFTGLQPPLFQSTAQENHLNPRSNYAGLPSLISPGLSRLHTFAQVSPLGCLPLPLASISASPAPSSPPPHLLTSPPPHLPAPQLPSSPPSQLPSSPPPSSHLLHRFLRVPSAMSLIKPF